jgi:mono/diheme cytochrome c family protein
MRLFFALFLALTMQSATPAVQYKIPLHTERASPGDLEIGGELAGVPAGATRYLRYDDLLKLPQQSFTVTDDTFRTPTQISGVALSDLAKMLGQNANMIVAVCYDSYRSNYSPEYLTAHNPVLVILINGRPRDRWPRAPIGDDLRPYLIANPNFKPTFKVLAHNDEEQIPYGVTRLEFRNGDHIYAPILPAPQWRGNTQVWDGYLIAREDCFRCHNSGAEGGTMGGRSWQLLGQDTVKDPQRFRTIIHSPQTLRPGARMPAEPAYDAATLDALVAYFRTFAPDKPIPDPGVKEPDARKPDVKEPARP